MHTKALYAGSFDPLTFGHLDVIKRAANIFDEVVIGVTVNLEKKSLFSFDERVEMIREATKEIPNVRTDRCEGLLAEFVRKNGFNVVVRGLRNTSDFNDEQSMDQLHKHLYPEKTETVYIMSDTAFSYISSTMAKQVVSLGGDGTKLVPECVLKKMLEKFNQ